MNTAELIPVSEWVYSLYSVTYKTEEEGRVIRTTYIAASSEDHLWSQASSNAPHGCRSIEYNVVKQNIAHPRVIGKMYGLPIHESGLIHGRRVALENNFV
jgi:hypothetical protein